MENTNENNLVDLLYISALQYFCYYLNYDGEENFEAMQRANELFESCDIAVLEREVLNKKEKMPIPNFYYGVGRTVERVISDNLSDDSCDEDFNLCCAGINKFERLCGILSNRN